MYDSLDKCTVKNNKINASGAANQSIKFNMISEESCESEDGCEDY